MATVAEGAEAVAGGGPVAASGGKRRGKLLLVLVVLAVVAAAGGAAFLAGLVPHTGGPAAEPEAQPAPAAPGLQAGAMRQLDPFLANLADEGGTRYLKMSLQVEFVGAEPPAHFDLRMAHVRDAVLTLVTSKTFADIRTSEGKERLREDLIDRMNHVLRADAVKSVYFTEFIVQ